MYPEGGIMKSIKYSTICSIRERYPWAINFVNSAILYPYRSLLTEYYYKKNPDQIYTFDFEGRKVTLLLPFRHDLIEQTIIAKKTFFEIAELQIVRAYIPPHANIVDIGANIGNHLVFFGLYTLSEKIYGFEPNPELYPILEQNVMLNGIRNKTILSQVAIGSKREKGLVCGPSDKKNICYTDKSVMIHEKGDIDIIPLDELIEERIDFIKIDVEGMELDVLKGGIKRISEDMPVLFIESYDITDIINLLAPLGYKPGIALANHNYLFIPEKSQEFDYGP